MSVNGSAGRYRVNDVFMCSTYPIDLPVEVTWSDRTTPTTPRIISSGIGNATAKILAA